MLRKTYYVNNDLRIRYKLLRALIKQAFFNVCCVEELFYARHISTGYGLSKEDFFFFFIAVEICFCGYTLGENLRLDNKTQVVLQAHDRMTPC